MDVLGGHAYAIDPVVYDPCTTSHEEAMFLTYALAGAGNKLVEKG